jgi:hypothetical protein
MCGVVRKKITYKTPLHPSIYRECRNVAFFPFTLSDVWRRGTDPTDLAQQGRNGMPSLLSGVNAAGNGGAPNRRA